LQKHVAGLVREQLQQVDNWQQQNEQDQRKDMQDLEGLMLQAVGGLEGLQQLLASPEGIVQGQAVGLQQVAGWMREMHASSSVIAGHLQRLHDKVDGIQEGLDGLKVGQDAMAALVMEMFMSMKSGRGGVARLRSGAPVQIIPKASIHIPEGALSDTQSLACGTVVRGLREGGGAVAVKLYNLRLVGVLDQRDAIHEAARLNRASHSNVVRCFGVVHDPDSAKGSCIHGSLVMEWVGGGNLCDWLQENFETGLAIRVQLARQVAAGLTHLHEQKLVHGDLKPQNILLQFMRGEELPEVCSLLYNTLVLCCLLMGACPTVSPVMPTHSSYCVLLPVA
jgi:serine/threonine protein kinase